jgi:hypothetical protein
MQIYIWRHSKHLSSWSMLNEPHICKENYLKAEVSVLADSMEQALQLLEENGSWDIDELNRIEPEIVPLTQPAIINSHIVFG